MQRLQAGYTINQLVSEYRALRDSVLKLWADYCLKVLATDPQDIMRFNEAIDQALAESVLCYSLLMVESVDNERMRFEAILQAVPVGIGMADKQGKLVLINAENQRMWSAYPLPECIAQYAEFKGWWADASARHGQPIKDHEWALARALSGEEVAGDIVEIEPFDQPGVRRTLMLNATPIRNANKEIIGSVVAQMDITRQVLAETALRDSENKFRTITNAMPQMVWSTLPDGSYDYFNAP